MPTRLNLAVLFLAIGCVAIPQNGNAQMRGIGMRAGFASHGELHGAPWRGHARRGIYLGDPFWYSDYAPDEPYYLDSTSPQVIVLQPQAADPEPPQPRVQPLMIELRGDQYVRTGGVESPDAGLRSAVSTTQVKQAADVAPHLPTVLVYRDGHREDISGYAIIKSVIYARGDYWRDGYWTKNIQLSALDIPATLKANQDNGVKFILPSAPNEVVTRP